MNTEPCNREAIMERALLSYVDLRLINYFNSLIKNVPEGVRALHYKSEVLNSLFSFYFENKDLYSTISGDRYIAAFTAKTKTLSFRLNDNNIELLNNELLICHRAKKEQVEYILISCFLLFEMHGINRLSYKKEDGLKTFKSNKPYQISL